jgi:hypothetical protein
MTMRLRVVALAGLTTMIVASGRPLVHEPPTALACGPFISFPQFTPAGAPDDPRYYAGSLGIVQSTYARRYLLVAWRTLNNRPLNDGEQRTFAAAATAQNGVTEWIETRKTVTIASPSSYFSPEALVGANFSYILNCSDSALRTAAETLRKRRDALGAQNEQFLEWVRTQDMVFSNCHRSSTDPAVVPEPLGADSPPLARADRAYQIAAALFYSGKFEEANAAFTAIGRDADSPWRPWGPYLAARALIRLGTLGGPEGKGDPAALARAETALKAVLDDPTLAPTHDPARQLLGYLEARSRPTEALLAAARSLDAPADPRTFARDLDTYEYLLNRAESAGSVVDLQKAVASSELLDWVLTFQGDEDGTRSLERWKATGGTTWLVSALSKLPAGHPQQDDLLAAAARLDQTSPAYPTVAFHRARLLLRSNRLTDARAVLDQALAAPALPADAINLFKAARLMTARSLGDFLQDAIRDRVSEDDQPVDGTATFDRDAIDAINQQLPLELLVKMSKWPDLPPGVRRDVTFAAFARAVLLRRAAVVRALIPELVHVEPPISTALRPLKSAPGDAALLDEATLLLLRSPGLRPFVTAGRTRAIGSVGALDNIRDNWWCAFAGGETPTATPYETYYWQRGKADRIEGPQAVLYRDPSEPPPLTFLTNDERRAAGDEWERLRQIDSGPIELGRRVLAWVEAHPGDSRAPEALHLIVRATRYGCTNERTGDVSHQAFRKLHSKYGRTRWAKMTPFWFR